MLAAHISHHRETYRRYVGLIVLFALLSSMGMVLNPAAFADDVDDEFSTEVVEDEEFEEEEETLEEEEVPEEEGEILEDDDPVELSTMSSSTSTIQTDDFSIASEPSDPAHVSFTLEGCRNPDDDPTYDPDGDVLICANASYTPGNLGQQWAELDLVPHRATLTLGSQAAATDHYIFVVAADFLRTGHEGYDFFSEPVVNEALTTGQCSVAVGPLGTASGIVGGSDETIYRTVEVQQEKGTTCVLDWVQRLAIGASSYPGSSLHAYLLNQEFGTGGIDHPQHGDPRYEPVAAHARGVGHRRDVRDGRDR